MGNPIQVTCEKTVEQCEGTPNLPMQQARPAFRHHEQGVITGDIVCSSVLNGPAPRSIRRSGDAMMYKVQIAKASGSPPKHVRLYLIYRIPSRRRPKAAYSLPAGSPVNLRGPADMERRVLLEAFRAVFLQIADDAAADAEPRISLKHFETRLKIPGLKCKISIQLNNEIPVRTGDRAQTVVESFDYSPPDLRKPRFSR